MNAASAVDVFHTLVEVPAPPELELDGALRLRRAWPRRDGHLLVEYEDDQGRRVAGQRMADPDRFRHVAGATQERFPGMVGTHPHLNLVLQTGGADRKLTALADLVDREGATLVVHRPERRAVVRLAGGRWAKVVRPARVPQLVAAAAALDVVDDVDTPRLLGADTATGTTLWSHVAGQALIDVLQHGDVEDAFRRVGAAVRRLHAAQPPEGLAAHQAAQEQQVLQTWIQRLHALTPSWAEHLSRELPTVLADLQAGHEPLVLSHGDLHDRQILVTADGVGLIDTDTVALREPAQDLANLLIHLELRGLQGLNTPELVAGAAAALVDGYAPGAPVLARVPAFAAATRLRLSAVYRLRPRSPHVSEQLLDRLHHAPPGLPGGSRRLPTRLSSGA